MSQKTSRKTVSSFCRCVGEEGETLRKGGWGVADCLEKRTRRRLNVTALVAPRRRNNGDSWPWRRNVKEKRGRGRKPFHTVCHTSLSHQFVIPVCHTSLSHQFVVPVGHTSLSAIAQSGLESKLGRTLTGSGMNDVVMRPR